MANVGLKTWWSRCHLEQRKFNPRCEVTTHTELAKINRLTTPHTAESSLLHVLVYTAGGSVNRCSRAGKRCGISFKVEDTHHLRSTDFASRWACVPSQTQACIQDRCVLGPQEVCSGELTAVFTLRQTLQRCRCVWSSRTRNRDALVYSLH